MKRLRLVPFFAMVLACIGCDLVSKVAAVSLLGSRAPAELLSGIVRFELAYNPGAFLSLGAGLPPLVRAALFGFAVPLGTIAATFFFLRSGALRGWARIALAMLAGGGLANGLDRLLHQGYVTDFVSVGVGVLRTGIFNVADVAVMAGVAVLLVVGSRASDEPEPISAGK